MIYPATRERKLIFRAERRSGPLQRSGAVEGVGVELSPFMVEVQVVGVEHRHFDKTRQIEDVQLLALKFDQAVAAQLLKGAVDVNRGEAGRVREVVLSQRKVATAILR